jgi:hypothetical protein
MKQIATIGLSLLVMFFLGGCRSASIFSTPNSMRNIPAILYLQNGNMVKGDLSLNMNGFNRNTIRIKPEGAKETFKYNIDEVKGYKIRYDYYELKDIRNNGRINFGRSTSFMRRLTPDDSRIHLFESMETRTSDDGNNNSSTRIVTTFYLQLPNENAADVWNIESNKFTPNFDEKMSRFVSDCPALARKIADREEGYFFRQISFNVDKRLDVIQRIIEEYNRCR